MNFFSRSILTASIVALTQNAWAAEASISVISNGKPVAGVSVLLGGKVFASTDASGRVQKSLPAGEHTFVLEKMGAHIAKAQITVSESEGAAVNVLIDADSNEAAVTVSKYGVDIKSTSGLVRGTVINLAGEAVSGANVEVITSGVSTTTNIDGKFELSLEGGAHQLKVLSDQYKTTTTNDIQVIANFAVDLQIKLHRVQNPGLNIAVPTFDGPVEELVTLGRYQPVDSAVAVERISTNVIDVMDAAQISRMGDSSIAIALTRLVGVTVTGGKYANVRGLDGRYISSTLNGFYMPSTDPMKRDVQLDLFPSSIVEDITIQKSYSPDLLGSTTGGALQINTKNLPEERVIKLSVKTGGNTAFTGDKINSYEDSNTDALGYDSGLRDVPQDVVDATHGPDGFIVGCDADFCTDEVTAAIYASQFQADYDVKEKKSNPSFSASLALGDYFEGFNFGFYSAIDYSYSTKSRIDASESDVFSKTGSYSLDTENYALNAYTVLGLNFRDQDQLLSKTILVRDTDNTTRVFSGIDNDEENAETSYLLSWVERQFMSQQFLGGHVFSSGELEHKIDWRVGGSNTQRNAPDTRQYYFLNGRLVLNGIERRWSELDEDSIDFGLDYDVSLDWSSNLSTEFQAGLLSSKKSRSLENIRFTFSEGPNASDLDLSEGIRLDETIWYPAFFLDQIRIAPSTLSTDYYVADEDIDAGYVNTINRIGDAWTVSIGGRYEDYHQSISLPNQTLSGNEILLDEKTFLPSFNISFMPSDSWQYRLDFSKTISYPGVTERAPAKFTDAETGREYFGNPSLQISKIDNIGLRTEFYLSDQESVSLAYFYKEIENPTERTLVAGSGSATDAYTYRNALNATVQGIEIDANINLFELDDWTGALSGNVAFTDSKVDIDELSLRLEGEQYQGRELQGQSPMLANIQLGFDHIPYEQKFTLLLNYFDDRIEVVNLGAAVGPRYEEGRTSFNFNYEKGFGDQITMKAQFKNLLNSKVRYHINGRVVEQYKQGVAYSLSLNWEL